MRPGPEELALVGAAVSALRKGLGPALHPSAAAVRTSSGTVVAALGLALTAPGQDPRCPEPAALAAALALGERAAVLVAVRHVSDDATRVTTPCRACRALLRAHAPALRVVHLGEGLQVSPVDALPG